MRRLAWGFRMQNVLIAIIGLVVTYSSDNETVKKIVADLKSYLLRLFEIIASLLR